MYVYVYTHTHNYSGDKNKYDYKCMRPVEGEVKQCVTLRTPLNDRMETNGVEFLDRHDVSCSKDEVLQAFHLQVLL